LTGAVSAGPASLAAVIPASRQWPGGRAEYQRDFRRGGRAPLVRLVEETVDQKGRIGHGENPRRAGRGGTEWLPYRPG
jgi:hypothetical protein